MSNPVSGPIIYAECPSDETSIQNAKDWIKTKRLTSDDVRLIRKDNTVMVMAVRNLEGRV